jgi:2-methylisocitrate lyase-like PEP mutase family enzyme
VAELAGLGVRRISVGAWFAFTALGALVEAATELRDQGTFGYLGRASLGARTALPAFKADYPARTRRRRRQASPASKCR